MQYPGGKHAPGVYQKIINQIPPHKVYIEPFAGGGAVLLNKRPAELSLICDLDKKALRKLSETYFLTQDAEISTYFEIDDGVEVLRRLANAEHGDMTEIGFKSSCTAVDRPLKDLFIYLDPPYLLETRSSKRHVYQYESTTELHEQLLAQVKRLTPACSIAISGYGSRMYFEALKGWRVIHYRAITRGGSSRIEYLWMNYPAPERLHDPSYVGADYRKRQDFRRKKARWRRRLAAMSPVERSALLEELRKLEGEA